MMKDLTKEELMQIIKESNKDILDEFSGYADQLGVAKRVGLEKYADFISQVRFILLDNMLEQVKADYHHGALSKGDVEYLISKECNERLMLIASTLEKSLTDLIGGDQEDYEIEGPIPLPPSRTQE
jgi:hypothetical protein